MELPIALFVTFLGLTVFLTMLGIARRVPALIVGAGIFFFSFVVLTDTIIVDSFAVSNGNEAVNHYDIQSSTGQVLINAVTAHSRGERLSNTSSILEGDTIDCITVYLGRSGSPPTSTLITVGVMDTSTAMVRQFGSMNVTQLLTSSNTPYQFCLPVGQTYTFNDTETVGIKYNAGDGSNTLSSRVDANDPFDGNNTEHVHATGSSWISNSGQDIMMIMTLRSNMDTEIVRDTFPFDDMAKVIFSLFGAVLMLLGGIISARDY